MFRTTIDRPKSSGHGGVASRRPVRITATVLAVGVTAGAIVSAGGGTAGAATAPQAQSVGNFLDATVGGMTLDSVAKLQYATAFAPGAKSAQNPLDVKALNQIELPLTNAIKLPSFAGIKLGAANQVAVAHDNGRSYGASGAVSNSGGASVGGDDNAYPTNASIDLTAAGLAGSSPIPIPGGSSLDALGGITASVGGVAALARTNSTGQALTPTYKIADLNLTLGSPALGGLLSALESQNGTLTTLLAPVIALLNTVGSTLPANCALSLDSLPSTISLDKGAVVIDPATGSITVSLDKLLKQLGLNINHLPANTDLVTYLVKQLPTILTTGLEGVVDGIITPLEAQFTKCLSALGPLSTVLGTLLTTLTTGEKTLEGTLNTIATTLSDSGASGLGALTDALSNVIDIGVNVQHGPGKAANNSVAPFHTNLLNTPKQGTPVVAHQTLVRALEIDLLSTSALTTNSASQHQLAGAHPTANLLSTNAAVTIALGNAAAGPSTPAVIAPTPTPTPTTIVPTTITPTTLVPTGVPAGAAGQSGGSPVLPIILLLLGLTVAGGGVVSFRMRRGFRH